MQPYAVGTRDPVDSLIDYRLSQDFMYHNEYTNYCATWMSHRFDGKRVTHKLTQDSLLYGGYLLFRTDEDAYQHWLKEYAPLDPCYDWSDEGKYSGMAYLIEGMMTFNATPDDNIEPGDLLMLRPDGTVSPASTSQRALGVIGVAGDSTTNISPIMRLEFGVPRKSARRRRSPQVKQSQAPFRRQGRG